MNSILLPFQGKIPEDRIGGEMRKAMVFFLALLIGFGATLLMTQTPEENFQKAAQEAKAKSESKLRVKKEGIMKFVFEIAEDGKVGKELKKLNKEVKKFTELKTHLDNELGVYDITTETRLPSKVCVMTQYVKCYEDKFWYKDTPNRDVKRVFAELTGKDVKIEKSRNYSYRAWPWGLVAAFVGLIIACIGGAIAEGEKKDDNLVALISWIAGFAIIFLFILFVL